MPAIILGLFATIAPTQATAGAVSAPPAPDWTFPVKIEFGRPGAPALQEVAGRWQTQPGVLLQTDAASASTLALAPNPQVGRCRVRTRLKLDSDQFGAEAGVVVHAGEPGVYVLCSIRRGKAGWYAGITRFGPYRYGRMPGDVARLADDAGRTWHTIEVETDGGHVRASIDGAPPLAASFPLVDGKPIADATTWGSKIYGDASKWGPEIFQEGGRIGLGTRHGAARFEGFAVENLPPGAVVHAPLNPEYDASGRVVPRWPYAWIIGKYSEWMLHNREWVSCLGGEPTSEPLEAVVKKTGWPPYILSWASMLDDCGLERPTQFPSHNGPPTISGFVTYYLFSGDPRFRKEARVWADWIIDHDNTPADYALPHVPRSTYAYFNKAYTGELIDVLEIDKASYTGLSYLDLYAVTGDEKYFQTAKWIAQTLLPTQQADGSFPFRIDLKTGRVVTPYTCSQIWHVRFYDRMAVLTGKAEYREASRRALQWLIDGPIKDNRWVGFYGDVTNDDSKRSYDQWVALETAQWLCDHHLENPAYLPAARSILAFVREKLTLPGGLHRGVPASVEQTVFPVILSHHNLRLAETYACDYGATGDPEAKELAIRIANSMTQMVTSDGKFRLGLNSGLDELAAPTLEYDRQLTRLMAEIPETAPRGENHLFYHSAPVKTIRYGKQLVAYETAEPGQEILVVAGCPRSVSLDGRLLAERPGRPESRLTTTPAGWIFEADSGRLFILHGAGRVEIQF